ncbi:MAG: hypothetical protein EPO02_12030 [Nitrospirae bacterium]|nr:MAG: hypothetical protein EPO02_12030 [Nitrospirota bacterium]
MTPLRPATLQAIARIFDAVDYGALGPIYCHEGGDAFWEERRGPCQELGSNLAGVLRDRLAPNGRSLYVGAGIAELPLLVMETMELNRTVAAYNLRADEVPLLNNACAGMPFEFQARDAREAVGTFDHLWIVSVLNDPECFPELGSLSSARANPVTFDPDAFAVERRAAFALAAGCLQKAARPGLVTTSVEEIPWITDWCQRQGIPCVVEDEDYPTAIVEDPVCFIRIGA